MGCGNSFLLIEFDRDPPLYFGGELLKGIVRVKPDDDQFSAGELSLLVKGCGLGEGLMEAYISVGRNICRFPSVLVHIL